MASKAKKIRLRTDDDLDDDEEDEDEEDDEQTTRGNRTSLE